MSVSTAIYVKFAKPSKHVLAWSLSKAVAPNLQVRLSFSGYGPSFSFAGEWMSSKSKGREKFLWESPLFTLFSSVFILYSLYHYDK